MEEQLYFDVLLDRARQLHFELCEIISALQKQRGSKYGMNLVTLKEYRIKSNQVKKIDLALRNETMEHSKCIHQINVEKWSKRKSQPQI